MRRNTALIAILSAILLFAMTPKGEAAPVAPSAAITSGARAAVAPALELVHGRRHGRWFGGVHCSRAWHPRRGWHRHAAACRGNRGHYWRRHHYQRRKGCRVGSHGVRCRF